MGLKWANIEGVSFTFAGSPASCLRRQGAGKSPIFAGSSNGRTVAFEAINFGSTPSPAARLRRQPQWPYQQVVATSELRFRSAQREHEAGTSSGQADRQWPQGRSAVARSADSGHKKQCPVGGRLKPKR